MVAILKILARKISKLIYFIMLLMFLGKTFPEAELYIGEDFATNGRLLSMEMKAPIPCMKLLPI